MFPLYKVYMILSLINVTVIILVSRGHENCDHWTWSEVTILGDDQKERSLWGWECTVICSSSMIHCGLFWPLLKSTFNIIHVIHVLQQLVLMEPAMKCEKWIDQFTLVYLGQSTFNYCIKFGNKIWYVQPHDLNIKCWFVIVLKKHFVICLTCMFDCEFDLICT